MEQKTMERYIALLREELVPALGCTEPSAIAYAAACARRTLGREPKEIEIACSDFVIKNAHSAVVPNSGGMKGIAAAAAMGTLAGTPEAGLRVLEGATSEQAAYAREWLKTHPCVCREVSGVDCLYVSVTAKAELDNATVTISGAHTRVVSVIRNGEILQKRDEDAKKEESGDALSVQSIVDFANEADLRKLKDVLDAEIQYNRAISERGLSGEYGLGIGKTLLEVYGHSDIRIRAKAAAAAGSEARMNGCPMAVVVNSGSGNQGLTVSLPVIEYADAYRAPVERLYRALIVSNLVAIAQKQHIGSLSAYCGAVCAAAGAGAGIAYLLGQGYSAVSAVITYTLATVGGMLCDGAKSSCAAKIAVALDAALTGLDLAAVSKAFQPGDGIVCRTVDDTIAGVGHIGREGMREANAQIMRILLGNA